MRTVKFITFGCKVNQYETQSIKEYFLANDFIEVKKGLADYYVINTCTVTHTADNKCIKAIKTAKRDNPEAIVAAIGCLAEKDIDILEEAGASVIIPHSKKYEIFNLLKPKTQNLTPSIWDFKVTDTNQGRAFVKIQDGCDNRCAFCKVNIVRGESKCRPYYSIEQEVQSLITNGIREIVLCGTNLGAWISTEIGFVGLLDRLSMLPGLGRIRLSSIEAPYVNKELINLIANNSKIASHIHIPFQCGDSEVLSAMNKHRASSEFYNQLIDDIRKQIPDCGISCDIMVAYPTETEKQFENTLSLIDQASSVRTHVFPFSPRPGTPAGELKELSSQIIKQRMEKAILCAQKAANKFMQSQLGKEYYAVFDTKQTEGKTYGYIDNYIRVVTDDNVPGRELIKVRLLGVSDGVMECQIL